LTELADTSAWTASPRSPDAAAAFDRLLAADEIATCEIVKLELLRTAQDALEFARMRSSLDELEHAPISNEVWQRATDVFQALAEQGPLHHRRVPAPDLLVAAAAELAGMPVVHYDRHFEQIAEITGQPVRGIAPLGSV